jgi:hypothetical protein
MLHAVRVLVYVLGRVAPWVDFDRRPEFRGPAAAAWFWVWFAAVMSAAGLVVVLVIYLVRRRTTAKGRRLPSEGARTPGR